MILQLCLVVYFKFYGKFLALAAIAISLAKMEGGDQPNTPDRTGVLAIYDSHFE